MAVIPSSVCEVWQGRAGGYDTEGKRDHVRMIRCETTARADDDLTVADYLHNNGYRIGGPHPNDPLSFLHRIDPRNQTFSPNVWLSTLNYSRRRRDPDDPLDDPVEISITNEKQQIPVWAFNSAGDLYDPLPLRDSNIKVANVTVTVPGNIPTTVLNFEDAVNTDTYTIGGLTVAPFKSKCSPFDVSIEKDRLGQPMRIMRFGIQISRRDLRLNALDMGWRELDADGNVVKIPNITVPAILNGSGHAVANPTVFDQVFNVIPEAEGGYTELAFGGVLPGCI